MGQFGVETRKWLEGAIKQRKLLLKLNKSHKSELEVTIAIQILDDLLNTYSYENDVYMARFIRQNIGWIENILPGSGATGYKKKMEQLSAINRRAILIIDQNPPMIPPRGGMKSNKQIEIQANQKTIQYEMDISKDPTAEDYDQIKLTPQEWRMVYRDCAICLGGLLVIFYLICW